MKFVNLLALGLIGVTIYSCANKTSTYADPYKNPFIVSALPIIQKDLIKFEEDKKNYDKEVSLLLERLRIGKQKEMEFMKSLSNEELQAYDEFKETYEKGDAKHLLAYRKVEALLQKSPDTKKLITFKWICREDAELVKQGEALNSKFQELEKKRKYFSEIAAWFEKEHLKAEENRRYQEIMSEIRSANFWNWHYQNQSLFQQQIRNQQNWIFQNNPGNR